MRNRAFTLLETLIYIGLFSLLCSGVLSASALLGHSARSIATEATLHDEGLVLLARLRTDWDRAGVSSSLVQVNSTTMLKSELVPEIRYHVSDGTLLREQSGEEQALTSSLITIESFEYDELRSGTARFAEVDLRISATTPDGEVRSTFLRDEFHYAP